MEKLRYPIGKLQLPGVITEGHIKEWIREIELFPGRIKSEVETLAEEELSFRHRPGGWTIRQIVHHTVDSHTHAVIRIKGALTEDKPLVKTYEEAKLAELPDVFNTPVESSLLILKGLHARWVALLRHLGKEELKKTFLHPDADAYRAFVSFGRETKTAYGSEISIEQMVGIYAWHCNHHLAHIRQAKKIRNNFAIIA